MRLVAAYRVPLLVALAGRLLSVVAITLIRFAEGQPYPVTEFDSTWYLRIVETGYHTAAYPGGGHDLAFFPGWPVAIKLGTLGFLDPALVGLILANVLSIVAIVVVWQVLRERFGEGLATDATVLLAFAPTAFVFALPYSEALFLLVVGLAFLTTSPGRRVALTAAAAVIRINGMALVVAWATRAWMVRGSARRDILAAAAAGVMAFLAWLAAVAWTTGDPLGFFHYGSAGQMPNSGIREMVDLVEHPLHRGTLLLHLGVVGLMALGALLVLLRDREFGLFSLAMAGLVLLPGATLKSDPRYLMMAFPAFAGLADRLGRRGTLLLALAFAALQVFFIRAAFPGGSLGRTPP
jgi:hypothetical protein